MSGFEIAGVVLGAFPALVSTLEAYHDCARTSRLWWKYEREFKKVKRRFETLAEAFRQSLLLIFLPVVEDEAALESLLKDTHNLDTTDVEDQLIERFTEKSYAVYLGIIRELQEELKELRRRIMSSWGDYEEGLAHIESRWHSKKRLIFALSEQPRDKLFSRVEALNDSLRNLISGHDQLPGNRANAGRDQTRIMPSGGLTRRQIQHLQRMHTYHTSLARTRCCDCRLSHCVDLLLNQISAQPRVSFHFDNLSGVVDGASQPWTSLASTICLTQQPDSRMAQSAAPCVNLRPPSPVSLSQRFASLAFGDRTAEADKADRAKKEKVMFTMPDPVPPSPMAGTQDPSNAVSNPQPMIINLCVAISTNQGDSLGHLVDPSPSPDSDSLIELRALDPSHVACQSGVTLLSTALQATGLHKPTRSQRLLIASKLTSYHLPQHSDSWFNGNWTKDDIVFPCTDGVSKYDEPQLRRRCDQGKASTVVFSTDNSHMRRPFSLLGILLLELCFGASLEDSPARKALPAQSVSISAFDLDLAAARIWAGEVAAEMGHDYDCAVSWCLNGCSIASRDASKDFHVEVAKPLQRCYEQFSGSL